MWKTSTLPAGSPLNCSTQWVRTASTVSCFPVAGLVCAPTDSVNTTNANSNNHLLIEPSMKLRIYQTGILLASGNNTLAKTHQDDGASAVVDVISPLHSSWPRAGHLSVMAWLRQL